VYLRRAAGLETVFLSRADLKDRFGIARAQQPGLGKRAAAGAHRAGRRDGRLYSARSGT